MAKLLVCISPFVYLQVAALILLLPLQWVFALAVSICVHEISHMLMFRFLNLPINGIEVYPTGIRILSPPLTSREELLCAAAGPIGGGVLIFLVEIFPMIAICAAFHTLYNLLPIRYFDGGRILRSFCEWKLPRRLASLLPDVFDRTVGVGVVFAGLYSSLFLRLGLLPLLLGCFALWHSGTHK